jgi:hypothetical protein
MMQQQPVVLSTVTQPQLQEQQHHVGINRVPPGRLSTAIAHVGQQAAVSISVGAGAVGSMNKGSCMPSEQDKLPLIYNSQQQQAKVSSLQAAVVSSVPNAGSRHLKAGGIRVPSSDFAARGMTATSSRSVIMTTESIRPAVMRPGDMSTSLDVSAGSVMPTANQLVPRLGLVSYKSLID